jgi:UDP-glucose 4-epimerase
MKEINVIGTMQLLAACQKAPSIRQLVVKSTTAVYGSSPWDPALFTEEMEPRVLPRSGFAKDCAEVEGYVRGFGRRRPDVGVTTLRFANFLGPDIDSSLSQYFTLPVLPTVLGYDARLQFIHEQDGLEVLRRAALEDHPGTFNAAGDGVMLLSQAARRLGRPIVPIPPFAVSIAGGLGRQLGFADYSSTQLKLLTHGRAVDVSRLRREFGPVLTHSTEEAFAAFIRSQGGSGLLSAERLAHAEQLVRSVLPIGSTVHG